MQDRSASNSLRSWLAYGSGGLAVGICLVMTVAGGLVVRQALNPPVPPTLTLPPTATLFPPTVTSPPPIASRTAQILLDQAKRDLAEGQTQHLIETLKPQLDQFAEVDDQAQAYTYLAEAEAQLGHFQFAAVYFEKVYALQPTAEHLFELARAYDIGGDLERALKKYQALVQLSGAEVDPYRSTAEERIRELLQVLGTRTPIIAPTPR